MGKKRPEKIIMRITAWIVMTAVFVLTWKILRFIVVDDASSYTRVTMHEFYNQENIDILFMGASHCYQGFNTGITDELLGVNTFNLGSSSQGMDDTYLLLQEADKRYDIKHVYLDLSYSMALKELSDSSRLTKTYILTDYMHPSFRKTFYLLGKTEPGNYPNSFLPARRDWERVFNDETFSQGLKTKFTSDYWNYAYPDNGTERYMGKGYAGSDEFVADGTLAVNEKKETFDLDMIDAEWLESVKKTIRYCNKNDIDITFISIPVSSYRLMCYGEYDDYIAYVNELLKEEGSDAEYVDFNLLKEEYWEDTSVIYKDTSHLNKEGAERFTRIFCDWVNGTKTEEELMYESVAEKYAVMPAAFYGIKYKREGGKKKATLVMNHPEELSTQVILKPEEGEEQTVKEWGKEQTFIIPKGFTGECRIEVKKDTGENEESTEVYIIQQ